MAQWHEVSFSKYIKFQSMEYLVNLIGSIRQKFAADLEISKDNIFYELNSGVHVVI